MITLDYLNDEAATSHSGVNSAENQTPDFSLIKGHSVAGDINTTADLIINITGIEIGLITLILLTDSMIINTIAVEAIEALVDGFIKMLGEIIIEIVVSRNSLTQGRLITDGSDSIVDQYKTVMLSTVLFGDSTSPLFLYKK